MLNRSIYKLAHVLGFRDFDDKWLQIVKKNPKNIKYYVEWSNLKDGKTNTIDYGLPWYTFSAIDWLKGYLKKDMSVFEWGSGGSTVFYAKMAKKVVSVENDPIWQKDVTRFLSKNKINNIEYLLIEPEKVRQRKNSDQPGDYRTVNKHMDRFDFKGYCTVIRRYPDESFDFIAIDGRARNSCVLEAIPKLKRGGYLLLDNTERDRYLPAAELLIGWHKEDFYGPVTHLDIFQQTTVFRKPSND